MAACSIDFKKAMGELLGDEDSQRVLDRVNQIRLEKKAAAAKRGAGLEEDELSLAQEQAIAEIESQVKHKKLVEYLSAIKEHDIRKAIATRDNMGDGLIDYMDDFEGKSTASLIKSSVGDSYKRLTTKLLQEDLLSAFWDKSLDQDLGRAMAGEAVKNPEVMRLAEVVNNVLKENKARQNRLGANIGEISDYIATHSHNRVKMLEVAPTFIERQRIRLELFKTKGVKVAKAMREMAFDRWASYISDKLDWDRMDILEADKPKFMRSVYDALVSGVHLKPAGTLDEQVQALTGKLAFAKPASLAEKISQSRLLHFKDADSWMDYNRVFGADTVHNSIINSIGMSGRTIGLLKTWGPNPRNLFDIIRRDAKEVERTDPKALRKIKGAGWLFDDLNGDLQSENITAGNIFAGIRSWIAGSKLGLILASSVADLGAKAALLGEHGVSPLDRHAKAVTSLFEGRSSKEMQLLDEALGTWSESRYGHMARFFSAGDTIPGGMAKAMETFFKLTGITWWDRVNRQSIASAVSNMLGQAKGKTFHNLVQKGNLELYGIGDKEWNLFRKNTRNIEGKDYITPDAAQDFTREDIAKYLGKKDVDRLSEFEYLEAIDDLESNMSTFFIDQTDQANIQPSVRDRQLILRGSKPGTWEGEAKRFMAQFKNFGIGFINRNIRNRIRKDGVGSASVIAEVMVASTLWGYVAMSSKDLSKGLVPRDPTDPKTWAAALLQGGGAGIYGDFLFSDYNRFGGGFWNTALGPGAGIVGRLASIYRSLVTGDFDRLTRQGFMFGKNNMPYLNLIYVRLAIDHLFLFGMQEHVSRGSLRRLINRYKKKNKQSFWVNPNHYLGYRG